MKEEVAELISLDRLLVFLLRGGNWDVYCESRLEEEKNKEVVNNDGVEGVVQHYGMDTGKETTRRDERQRYKYSTEVVW